MYHTIYKLKWLSGHPLPEDFVRMSHTSLKEFPVFVENILQERYVAWKDEKGDACLLNNIPPPWHELLFLCKILKSVGWFSFFLLQFLSSETFGFISSFFICRTTVLMQVIMPSQVNCCIYWGWQYTRWYFYRILILLKNVKDTVVTMNRKNLHNHHFLL